MHSGADHMPPRPSTPLVTDMDDTLLKTDTLWEGFFAMLSMRPIMLVLAPLWLLKGRAYFKKRLAPFSAARTEKYPVNHMVLRTLQDAVSDGREVYLASAADRQVAEAVSRRFGFFADVFASEEGCNLKGKAKADLLTRRFGEKQFDYIGDSGADIPIWKAARTALVVTQEGSSLEKQVGPVNSDYRILGAPAPGLRDYFKAFRVHQWIKNILLFVPLLLAHQFTPEAVKDSLLAFISFCLGASAIYVINDLYDLASDRQHPKKKNRPFASGVISVRSGSVCFVAALAASFFFGTFLPWKFMLCLVGYFALTISYTIFLKRRLFLDVVALAALYVIRLVGGAAAIGSALSSWLLAFGIFIFLGLALMKRAGDLIRHDGLDELHGRAYRSDDTLILEMMAVCAGFSSVVVSALYVDSLKALQLYKHAHFLWGVCLVLIYWYGRLCLKMHRGETGDDPVAFAVKDKVSHVCFLFVCVLIFLAA